MCHPNPLEAGTMDNKVVTTTCRAFNQMGVPSLRFNFRGIGQSEGESSGNHNEIEDLKAILAFVREKHPSIRLFLGGFSFGAWVSYEVAQTYSCEHLLSIAPAVNRHQLSINEHWNCPWTIVTGDQDEVVSITDIYNWLVLHPASYHLIKCRGVGHFFHGQLVMLKKTLIERFSPVLIEQEAKNG